MHYSSRSRNDHGTIKHHQEHMNVSLKSCMRLHSKHIKTTEKPAEHEPVNAMCFSQALQLVVHCSASCLTGLYRAQMVCMCQVRLRLAMFAFFILSIVLLFFVDAKSCRSYEDTWLGRLHHQHKHTQSHPYWMRLLLTMLALVSPAP